MGAEQEQWLFDNLATVKARWTVHRPAGATRSRYDRAKANPDGQFSMDKWDGYVAARQRLYNRLLETQGAEPDRAVGRRAPALRRRSEDRLHRPAIGDRRRRVHQHRGDDRPATAATSAATWEATQGRQPAHQVPQQPARLHRLHGDARADARRLQDPRQGDACPICPPASADRWSSRRDGRAAIRIKAVSPCLVDADVSRKPRI